MAPAHDGCVQRFWYCTAFAVTQDYHHPHITLAVGRHPLKVPRAATSRSKRPVASNQMACTDSKLFCPPKDAFLYGCLHLETPSAPASFVTHNLTTLKDWKVGSWYLWFLQLVDFGVTSSMSQSIKAAAPMYTQLR